MQPAKAIRIASGWKPPQAGRSAPDRKKVEERKFPIDTERTRREAGGPARVRSLEDRNPLEAGRKWYFLRKKAAGNQTAAQDEPLRSVPQGVG